MACAKQRIRRCVPKGWNVPPVPRAKKAAKKKAAKRPVAAESAGHIRILKKKAAPLRSTPKKAAKKPASTESAAAHRGAVRAGFVPGSAMYQEYIKQPRKQRAKKTGKKGTRARFEGRLRVWMREAMADQGVERDQYTVDFEQKPHGFGIVIQGVEPWERGVGRKMSNALQRVGKRFNKYAVSRVDDPEKQWLMLEKDWRASSERAKNVKLDREYFERPTYGYRGRR